MEKESVEFSNLLVTEKSTYWHPATIDDIIGIKSLQMVYAKDYVKNEQTRVQVVKFQLFFLLDGILFKFNKHIISKGYSIFADKITRDSGFPGPLLRFNHEIIIPDNLLFKEPIVCNIGVRCLEPFCTNHNDAFYFIDDKADKVILEFGYNPNTEISSVGLGLEPFMYYDLEGYTTKFLMPESEEDKARRKSQYENGLDYNDLDLIYRY
jgi:hypothetical protein